MLEEIVKEKLKEMGFDTNQFFIKIGKNKICFDGLYIKVTRKTKKHLNEIVNIIDMRYIDCIKETEKSIIFYCDNHWCYKKIIRKGGRNEQSK